MAAAMSFWSTHPRILLRLNLLVLASLGVCTWFTVQLPLAIIRHQVSIKKQGTTTARRHEEEEQEVVSVCETRTIANNGTSSSIAAYLSQMAHPEDWLLLKWNPDGSYDSVRAQAKTHYQQWAPPAAILGNTSTTPSDFGKIVLLFNSDRVAQVPWDLRPPVPVWTFSKPTSGADPLWLNVSEPIQKCDLDRVTVVPNPYDVGNWNRFCIKTVEEKMTKRLFSEKINQVVWRGAVHSKPVEKSRVALLEYSRQMGVPDWLNVQAVNHKEDPGHLELYELADYRYHLDAGGVSGTAWGGMRWKLCTGLLVFQIQSWADDWWYDTLVPWVHYIPVRPDVSDLFERYQWTQDHPVQAEAIAAAGQQQCLQTFGPDGPKERYRTIIQNIPAADQALVNEADEILAQLRRLDTDLAGLPSMASLSSSSSRP